MPRAARAVVIDRRQYGCAKAPFCSLSAALRKLLHPHLRIHAKSNRPPVHSRPSVRTSVRLSSPIIARTVHQAAAFFRSPAVRQSGSIDSPGYKPKLQRYIGTGILLSRLDIEILPNTIETPSTAMEITINEKGQIARGRNKKKIALPRFHEEGKGRGGGGGASKIDWRGAADAKHFYFYESTKVC